MPSLWAFKRRWNISSDDFVFPSITEALVRSIWILAAIGLFFFHNPSQCKSLEWMIYLGLLVGGNIITILLCISIAFQSAKGSILEMNARKNVVKLIYCRVPLFLAEVVYTALSAIFAFGLLEVDTCFSMISLRITVVLELFLIFCVFFGILVVFNPHGSPSVEQSFLLERRYWQTRMMLCKIRQNDEMRSALDEIASLLAAFFAETDYVASDILAGLLLLVHSPEQPPSISMQINSDNNYPDWMRLPNSMNMICRMLDYAVASYGWPSYLLNNCSCLSWFKLLKRTGCCSNCGQHGMRSVVDDNCCSCNTASFLIEANVDESDIFYISFRNKLFQTPFVVLADHSTRSIVITIRGSASILDFVTDLSLNDALFSVDVDSDPILCEDDELDSDGRVRVHRGMLRSAHFVYNTLKKNRVIEDLRILYPNHQLIVTGHSLGAGVASLLTLLLKQTYQDIKCYAFSPPCVISEHGIDQTEQHVLSIIIGDDIIPRISYQSLMRLKDAIDFEISATNRAKFEILIKGIFKLFFSAPWDLHSDVSSDNRSCRRLLQEGYADQHGTSDNVSVLMAPSESTVERIRLYPPGKLLHFAFDPTTQEATTNWIKHDYLKDIQLTGAILADHMPYKVRKLLRRYRDENVPI